MKPFFLTAVLVVGTLALGKAWALDERLPEPRDYNLSADIDTWFEGEVVAIDRDFNTLTVHGSVMPYATQHARMLREIADKTAGLEPRKRAEVEADIRAKWADRFEKSRGELRRISDRRFVASADVALLDERDASNLAFLDNDRTTVIKRRVEVTDDGKKEEVTTYVEHRPVREERMPLDSMRDLKLGDRVMIGYISDPKSDTKTRTTLAVIRERPVGYSDHYEREDRGEVEKAGRTMEHGLENGANKIKHFFTGHD
jgi:gamma-glutamylcyclotransferase (GGCT)/AIG2-like uncharacterized protein YtfP